MFKTRKSTRRRRSWIWRLLHGGTKKWLQPSQWLQPSTLLALLGLTITGSSLPTASLPVALAVAQPQQVQQAQPIVNAPAPTQSPLDWPLRYIAESQREYYKVQTYKCLLISRERVNGKLLDEQVMELSFRKNPFSVYMKWLAPRDKIKQEVCYVQGKYQNSLRATSPIGWVSVDVNSSKVKENSNHVITETGFGNLIERCAKSWEAERTLGMTQVQVAEYEYNRRRCIRIETIHTARHQSFYCYRSVVYFDKETKLPVRMECYDWPRQGGDRGGELMECFSYVNLDFNVQLTDAVFTH